MRYSHIFILLIILSSFGKSVAQQQPSSRHNLVFNELPKRWDEAIPLGNGMVGALVWQKDTKLRLAIDRADIWDLRPMKGLNRPEMSYAWVQEQYKKNNYKIVQQYFDEPYEREPAPTKIPGAALEFDIQKFGKVKSAQLYLENALSEVVFESGIHFYTFVHATKPLGWFRFENCTEEIIPQLIPPKYQGGIDPSSGGSVAGDDLTRLGYKIGNVEKKGNTITYLQTAWGGMKYKVSVSWRHMNKTTIEGVWSISSQYPNKPLAPSADGIIKTALASTYEQSLKQHQAWWNNFWKASSINLPDTLLEKQYYLELYKFGAAARRGAPPISLQAIWTADNGRIPPWKGDFHHDLNTELSYWPAYTGNHLEEGLGYIDHLEANIPAYKKFTKGYFNTEGLAVPGVTTLTGEPLGGWIQYSFSPTTSAWLAHHYYLHWQYSQDKVFLQKKAYPWVKNVATFFEKLTIKDKNNKRRLPLSSSPEIHDNSREAWFEENTNYDLALMRFAFYTASEMALALGLKNESLHWKSILSEFNDFALSENNVLLFAPNAPYNESHRHFSNMMAVYPLSLIKWENGIQEQIIIQNSINLLDKVGPDYWCGYSYAWLGNLKARAKDGKGAAEALQTFASAFCSTNSFHLNGDQTKSGKSKFTYRPFTLEGNFAFAAGIQEMLIQSYAGFIEIMPAIPSNWKEVSFNNLRTMGGFLVSVRKEAGQIDEVRITSEKGGKGKIKLPFKTHFISAKKDVITKYLDNGFIEFTIKKGGYFILKNGYE